MNVFISFSEADRQSAQTVASALRGEGYKVVNPPPSGSGETGGSGALGKADFLVFLITPDSVVTGGKCLSELFEFRKRRRNAKARILPIVARETSDIPKSISDLEPVTSYGNLPADVLNSIAARRAPGTRNRRLAAGAAAVAIAGAGAFFLFSGKSAPPATLAVKPEFVVMGADQFVYWGSKPVYGIKLDKPGSLNDYSCKLAAPTGGNIVKATADDVRCKKISVETVSGPYAGVTEYGFQVGGTIPFTIFDEGGSEVYQGAVELLMSNTGIMLGLEGVELTSEAGRTEYAFERGTTHEIEILNDGEKLAEPHVCEVNLRGARVERVGNCRFKLAVSQAGTMEVYVTGREQLPKLFNALDVSLK